MTITARILKATVTLPIIGTLSRDEHGYLVKKGERYRIHIFAAKPGWRDERPVPDFLVVGVLTGAGFTSEPTRRSQQVLVPEGRELVAIRMDEDGLPLSWESLSVEIAHEVEKTPCEKSNETYIDKAFISSAMSALSSYSLKEEVKEIIKAELSLGGLLHKR